MLDFVASYLIRSVNLIFYLLPMRFILWLGGSIGSLVYLFNGRRSRVTYSNLKAAFCGEKLPSELRRLTRKVYSAIGRTFAEILAMTKMGPSYINKYVKVHNIERIENASRNPNGMILVSAHFGNWEMSTVTSAVKGFPLYLLARDQKMARLNELLNKLRESKGNIVVRKGMDVKNIFRLLKEGKSIGILADQNAGPSGVLVDFFGRQASVASGPFRFAARSGAVILPAFIHRRKGPYHDLVLEEPMVINEEDDVVRYMKKYNELLEKHVRERPEQWFWMHKRWKMTPVKKVLVLDDGRKGHLKQSLAVVGQIRRFRSAEGFRPEHLEVAIARVSFRNKLMKVFLSAVSPFASRAFGSHLASLALALDGKSYGEILRSYADVVVSCGSSLSAVNRLIAMENSARSVTVLDPGFLLRNKFDLVIMSAHDAGSAAAKKDNVVLTDLAPNLIESFEPKPPAGPPRVGILVGGSNKRFAFAEKTAEELAAALIRSHEESASVFRVTTSRRTPPEAEEVIKFVFHDSHFCEKFVSGKKDTDERTVEKIMEWSDVVIVSGESISMVSEAVSSGRPVIVFMPEKKAAGPTKYERFVKNLAEKGYVKLVEIGDIPRAVGELTKSAEKAPLPDYNRKIYEKLYRLF